METITPIPEATPLSLQNRNTNVTIDALNKLISHQLNTTHTLTETLQTTASLSELCQQRLNKQRHYLQIYCQQFFNDLLRSLALLTASQRSHINAIVHYFSSDKGQTLLLRTAHIIDIIKTAFYRLSHDKLICHHSGVHYFYQQLSQHFHHQALSHSDIEQYIIGNEDEFIKGLASDYLQHPECGRYLNTFSAKQIATIIDDVLQVV